MYLAAGATLIGAYYLMPVVGLLPALVPRLGLYCGLSYSAAAAIVVGVRRRHPRHPAPWYLLAASQFVGATADATFYIAHDALHQQRFPALADLFYLSHYPILIAGLLLLVRQRTPRGDRASLIDASIVVPDEILLKPGPLTDRELAVMRRHPVQGARLVGLASGLQQVAQIVRQHHEHFAGGGYPDDRAGQDIRIEARIVAVCDAWAAMRANRAYRDAVSLETARQQLRVWSGTQFDPAVVAAFLELERSGVTGNFEEIRRRSLSLGSEA